MAGPRPDSAPLGQAVLGWLALGVLLAGLPHWPRLPIWLPFIHIALLAARLYLPYRRARFWRERQGLISLLRLSLAAGGAAGVYAAYGALTGRDAGIALLVLLAGLKIFESRTGRDFYVAVCLGYFLVITNFFYSQAMPTAIYMFFVIIILTACLINFNDLQQRIGPAGRLRLAARLIMQSIPVLIVLFVLFPRVNGPLWGLPEDAHSGVSGIDDQMTPGAISRLVESDEVAFRVTFAGEIPPPAQLYWRGPVLWQTDGRKWTPGWQRPGQAPVRFSGEPIRYEVIQEPSNKHWLFGLELIAERPAPSAETYLTGDHQFKTKAPIKRRRNFTLSSHPDYYLGARSRRELEAALRLPAGHHARSTAFGRELRARYAEPERLVRSVLEWFRSENFVYTLTPPRLAGDNVDDFLFDTRLGFCEHYAAAFTVLMRAAGIPARVVTGYQGGEVNPLGNYLIVRQRHAHAWSEVWLGERGWTRVDPTSVISARVDEGIENTIPEAVIDMPLNLEQSRWAAGLWQGLRNAADIVNYRWAQWVLGYGPERQQLLLGMIGFENIDWKKLTFIMMALVAALILILAFCLLAGPARPQDPARRHYAVFCGKMAKTGLPRKSHEGPAAYARRLFTARQDLADEIRTITDLYILIRYRSDPRQLAALRAAVSAFSPARRRRARA